MTSHAIDLFQDINGNTIPSIEVDSVLQQGFQHPQLQPPNYVTNQAAPAQQNPTQPPSSVG